MADGRMVHRSQSALPPAEDWSRFSLEQIWHMLEPQSRAHGQVTVAMWARMRRVCEDEADALDRALAKLAEHWPPTQEAALAFQQWGADLVRAMRGTAHTAERNGPIVDVITGNIEAARKLVAGLTDEAAEYEQVERQYGRQTADMAYTARHGFQLPGGATVPWRESLTGEARQAMARLEQQIAGHHPNIADETPHDPTPPKDPYSRPVGASSAGGSTQGFGSDWEMTLGGQIVLDGQVPGSGPGSAVAVEGVGAGGASPFVDTQVGTALAPGGVIRGLGTAPNQAVSAIGPIRQGGMVPLPPSMMAGQGTNTGSGVKASSARRRSRLPSVFQAPDAPPGIIRPPDEPLSHDPGPGVIGLDR